MSKSNMAFVLSVTIAIFVGVGWFIIELPPKPEISTQSGDIRAIEFVQMIDDLYKSKTGHSSEYYQSADLNKIFPALEKEDFIGVKWTRGTFHVDESSFYMESDESLSAWADKDTPTGITLEGYATLMNNVATRFQLGEDFSASDIYSLLTYPIKITYPTNGKVLYSNSAMHNVMWNSELWMENCDYVLSASGETGNLILDEGTIQNRRGNYDRNNNVSSISPKENNLNGFYVLDLKVTCPDGTSYTDSVPVLYQ